NVAPLYIQCVGLKLSSLSLHDALPISMWQDWDNDDPVLGRHQWDTFLTEELAPIVEEGVFHNGKRGLIGLSMGASGAVMMANNTDRKSTRLNSSHVSISYAVFCLKTKR